MTSISDEFVALSLFFVNISHASCLLRGSLYQVLCNSANRMHGASLLLQETPRTFTRLLYIFPVCLSSLLNDSSMTQKFTKIPLSHPTLKILCHFLHVSTTCPMILRCCNILKVIIILHYLEELLSLSLTNLIRKVIMA